MRRTTQSAAETRALAGELAAGLRVGDVLALHGELGAGKTCFIQGLAAALGVREAVSSPTYTLVHEYAGRVPLYHLDLYRLRGADEALAMGLDEWLEGDGVTVIEWAERAAEVLPARTRHVYLRHGQQADERVVEWDRE